MITRPLHSIFAPEFLALVTDTLNAKCVDGEALTRAELCHELGLTEPLLENSDSLSENAKAAGMTVEAFKDAKSHNLLVESVVGSLVGLEIIQGFEARKGPGGGIGKVGEKRSAGPKDPSKKAAKNVEFPEGFIDLLSTTIEGLCTGNEPGTVKVGPKGTEVTLHTIGCSVPRRDIAKAMGQPGSDTEALISAALAAGHLPGFTAKRGVGGGIIRLAPGETPATLPEVSESPETSESADEVVLSAGEPVVIEGPEATVNDPEAAVEFLASLDEPQAETAEAASESAEEPAPASTPAPKGKRNRSGGKKGKKAA